jgi:dipeptidyl-peptidase-4
MRSFQTPALLRAIVLAAGLVGSATHSPALAQQRAGAAAQAPVPDPDFLRDYAESSRYSNGKPASITLLPDGEGAIFLRSGPRSAVRDLYFVDPNGRERTLLTAAQVLGGGEERLSAEELARRERMRLSARGIVSYSVSEDGSALLVPLSGRLFLVDRATGQRRELPGDGGSPLDARMTKDASLVGVVRDGDLYLIDTATNEQHRITNRSGDAKTVSYGEAEFVAQEEMGRRQGYWIAPDLSAVVYQRTDVDGLETFTIADPANPAKAAKTWPYPRAGTKNADVRLFVQSLNGATPKGAPSEIRWDRQAYPYLAKVEWQTGAPLTILVQNRAQTEQKYLSVDPGTGYTTELLTERDAAWINIDDFTPKWIDDGAAFLWATEKDAGWTLEMRDRAGRLMHTVVEPSLGFRSLGYIDEDAFGGRGTAFVSASDDPTQTHVYRVPLYPDDGPPVRITAAPGSHSLSVAKDGSTALLSSRPLVGEATATLYDLRNAAPGSLGDPLGEMRTLALEPNFKPSLEFTRTGSRRDIDAVIIRPREFDPTLKYPVIVNVYGGPTSVMVERVSDRYLFQQWVADHGFIVVSMDGRGTPRRSAAWQRAVHKDFITQPLEDQAEGIVALGERYREMDLSRVGIYGWSYGGYFSAMAVMLRPDVFSVGVAGAPVADWADYDTHYTERYAGHPETDAESYRVSNVLTYADQLERPLLIIHGTADDNVYFVHGLKIANALFAAGKDFDFLPLSNQTHMVRDPEVVVPLWTRVVDYFEEHLGGPERAD